uniref:Integron gene cassette protein n=1 Tax=Toxocara canis TaxID=6265 RepID=A0A183ULN9_TOXCA
MPPECPDTGVRRNNAFCQLERANLRERLRMRNTLRTCGGHRTICGYLTYVACVQSGARLGVLPLESAAAVTIRRTREL